jgi:tRNA(fMet)-specific endonuclease VapC
MSRFVLDTDMLSLWQHDHPIVVQRVSAHRPDELAVTVITVQEQLDGWHSRLPRAHTAKRISDLYRRLADTVRFLSRLPIVDYSEAAVLRFEQIRKQHPKIGRMDLRIAAIVLEHNLVLVTRNRQDFQRIPGLQIEDLSQ